MDDVSEDDDGIRERLIDNDQQALAELFALHRQRLWRVAHFRTDSRLSARIDTDTIPLSYTSSINWMVLTSPVARISK
jgi:hypothetical protein